MIALRDIFEKIKESGNKALVFVRYLKTLEIIRKLASDLNITFIWIEGSMSEEERKQKTKELEDLEAPLIMGLTYQSSSLGLNLQAADIVIHYDRWWNPAIEKQAEDRAHRMGRNGDVTVYYMHCENSIDEKIEALQSDKLELVEKTIKTSKDSDVINKLIKDYKFNIA